MTTTIAIDDQAAKWDCEAERRAWTTGVFVNGNVWDCIRERTAELAVRPWQSEKPAYWADHKGQLAGAIQSIASYASTTMQLAAAAIEHGEHRRAVDMLRHAQTAGGRDCRSVRDL